ncbi:MAG TPA: rhodanese-like domain-containing protein [Lutibacter sp.]|nr:rhodanese-like domain-containing protein [Lutibacter sp.]
MKRIELIIIGVLVLVGFLLIFIPNTEPFKHVIGEKELLYEANKEGRYISTDEIAKVVIEADPSFLIIDLRTPNEYKHYTIEGAINIPYSKIMDDANLDYFDQDVYTTVLFSNGTSLADQAWVRLRSYDYKGNKVLKGGLNEWYKTIINPQKPNDFKTAAALEQYQFRKGASIYFTGAQEIGNSSTISKPKSNKPLIRRKKKSVSGGCG